MTGPRETLEQPLAMAEEGAGRNANPLGFDLEFRAGQALVVLKDRRPAPGLIIDRLELEIPGVSFPFDLREGAGQFRHTKCRLCRLEFRLEGNEALRRLETLAGEGRLLTGLRLQLQDEHGWLAGRWRVGEREAPFTARFTAQPWQDDALRLGFFDVRLWDWLPAPPVALVGLLGKLLQPLGAEAQDAAFLLFRPLRPLMRWLLPSRGWKLPHLEGVRIEHVSLAGAAMSFSATRNPADAEVAACRQPECVTRESLEFHEGAQLFCRAEQELSRGRLEQARREYLGPGAGEPRHPFALARLCEMAFMEPARHDQLGELAAELSSRQGERPGVLLLRAAVARYQKRSLEAGRLLEQAGRLCQERGEVRDAVLAHRLAAELLARERPEEAEANLEQLLRLEPDDLEALRRLAQLHESAGRHYRALRGWLRLSRLAREDRLQAEAQLAMARLHLERLSDAERAARHLEAALLCQPADLKARLLLSEAHLRRGRPELAARTLQELLELGREQAAQDVLLEARLRLASLWLEQLDQPENALAQLEKVLESDPRHPQALRQAGFLAARLERWPQSTELLARLLELPTDQVSRETRKQAALELGRIYSRRAEGLEEAREYYQRAAELDATDTTVWQALEQIDRRLEHFGRLVQVLEQRANLAQDGQERLSLLLETARLYERRLSDTAAAEKFYRQALQQDPGNREAQEGLHLLLSQAQRFEELAQLLEALAQQSQGQQAAHYWARLGHLRAESLQDADGAIQAWRRALELDPAAVELERPLLRFFRREGRQAELLQLCQNLPPTARVDRKELLALALEYAEQLAAQPQTRDAAIVAYQKVLLWDEENLPAHRALAELACAAGRHQLAAEHLRRTLELAGEGDLSPEQRCSLHLRLADALLENQDAAGAVEQLQVILRLQPQNDEAAGRLAELLRRLGRWEELAQHYAHWAQWKTGEEAAALHTACATIWQERRQRLDEAVRHYRLAIRAAPDSAPAEARLSSLQRLLSAAGRWPEVAEVIRQRIALCPPARQARLWTALGSLQSSRLGQPSQAIESWEKALAADPTCRSAAILLARRYRQDGLFEQALRCAGIALRGKGPLAPEVEASLALQGARSAWALQRLEEAAEFYGRHLEAYATRNYADCDPEAWERLELILRQNKDHQGLALLLRRRLRTELAPEQRTACERSLAILLFEHLEQPEQALELLTQALAREPTNQATVEQLAEMLARAGRWERLAELWQEHWSQAPTPGRRLERLEQLAEIYHQRLFRPAQAAECYRRLLELGRPQAAERLAAALRQMEKHRELADLLARQAEQAEPGAAEMLLEELADVAALRLQDAELELRARRRLLQLRPGERRQEELLAALRRLHRHDELRRALGEFAAEEEDDLRRRRLLLEHAECCRQPPVDPQAALESLRAALEIQAEPEPARLALQLHRDLEQWAGVGDMLELLADLAATPAEAAERLCELAQVYRERLAAPESARAALWRALELQPGHAQAMRQLEDLLPGLEDWVGLAELYQHRAQSLSGEEALAAWWQVSEWRLRAGQKAEALAASEQALALCPHDRRAWLLLLDTLAEAGNFTELLRRLCSAPPELLAAPELERWLWLCEAHFAEQGQPLLELRRLLHRQRRLDGSRLLELADMEEKAGEAEEAERLLLELEESPAGLARPKLAEVYRRLAERFLARGQDRLAEERLRKWLELEPASVAAFDMLQGLLRREGRWPELVQLLSQRAEGEADASRRRELLAAAAEILDLQIGDAAGAAQALEQALEPDDLQGWLRLEDLYRRLGRSRARLELLQKLTPRLPLPEALRLIKQAATDSDEVALLGGLAELALRLESPEDWAEILTKKLQLLASADRWPELSELLKQAADRGPPQPAAGMLVRGAKILKRAGLVTQARQALEKAVALEPGGSEAWELLAPLLADAGEWERLLEGLEKRAAGEAQPERRLARLLEMGLICQEHLHDQQRAAGYFERCLEIDPQDAAALESLAEIEYRGRRFDRAEELYRRLGERGLQASRFMVFYRRGEMAHGRGQAQLAIEYLRRSIQLNPTFLPSRQLLCALYQELGSWEEAEAELSALLELLEREGFEDLVLQTCRQLAETRRRLMDFTGAAEMLRRVCRAHTNDLESLSRLRQLLVHLGEWGQAADCLEQELQLAPGEADGLWLLLADVCLRRLNDPARARKAYLQLWERQPEQPAVIRGLWDCLLALRDESLLELGPRLAEAEPDPERRWRMERRLMEEFARAGKPQQALEHAERLLAADRVGVELVEQAALLCRSAGRWERFCSLTGQLIEARLAKGGEASQAAGEYTKLAGVFQEQLGDIDSAVACLRRALELTPRQPALLRRLGNLYACSFETFRQAVAVFRELLGMEPTDSENYRYLARLEGARGNVARTAAYYRGLKLLVPGDEEAERYLQHLGPPMPPARPLTSDEWERVILHPDADCLLQRVFALLAPHLEPLFPRQENLWQQSRPLQPGELPELVRSTESAAWVFGCRPFGVRLVETRELRSWLDCEGQPVVLLSRGVTELPPEQMAFWVAREVAQIALGHVLPRRLNHSDLEILLSLLGYIGQPPAPERLKGLPPGAMAYLEAIRRSLPAGVAGTAASLLHGYALEPRAHDHRRWLAGVQQTADRAALLLTGDLEAGTRVVELLAGQSEKQSEAEAARLGLLRFAFSEDYLELSQAVRTAV